LRDTVAKKVKDAMVAANAAGELASGVPEDILIETPKETGHGDFACTAALGMAREEKKNPRVIAETIIKHIDNSDGIFEKVEVAGPGFINFFMSQSAWLAVVSDIERQGGSFGHSHIGGGKKVQVEFVSANPTGPLHIGHGRGAAVGDSLCRLLGFAGYDVRREFYINDYGSQVENLGNSIYMRYGQLNSGMGAEVVQPGGDDADTSNLYMGEYITDLARVFMEYPGFMAMPEDDKKAFCRAEGMRLMLAQIRDTLNSFGVSFDEWYSESTLYGPDVNLVEEAVEELRDKGYVYESGDALWLRTTDLGDDKDRVMVRSNGQMTYFASDIAYHRDKYGRGFERIIDIWGADHHGYIPRMKAAIEALGHDPDGFDVLLVQLVNLMREGEPVKMSKRSGDFVTLREVLEEVGADACRFTFLLRRSDSPLDFDLELVKRQSSDNPVYYVQYAHARICSVFSLAEERGMKIPEFTDVDLSLLTLDEEMSIIKKLGAFPELIEGAAVALEPHRITYYLQDLAGELHAYYFKHKFISDDEKLSYARLYLVKSVRTVVATALRLLGVSAPDKM
jgi:arginyl-tRNA synthetase